MTLGIRFDDAIDSFHIQILIANERVKQNKETKIFDFASGTNITCTRGDISALLFCPVLFM
jgi:hypothetical protein